MTDRTQELLERLTEQELRHREEIRRIHQGIHPDCIDIGDLSPPRQRLVRSWITQFRKGAEAYPDFDLDTRNLPKELREELQDASSYLQLLIEQLRDARRSRDE